MKKIVRAIVYLLILSIPIAALVYTLPRNMQAQYTGVEFRLGDLESAKSINVQMNGSIQKRFFEYNRFRGDIKIGEHSLDDMDVVLNPDGALLMVRNNETGKLERFGVLYTNSDLSQWTMAVLEPVVIFGQVSEEKFWDVETGLMISAPAGNRQEALTVSNDLLGNLLEEPLK